MKPRVLALAAATVTLFALLVTAGPATLAADSPNAKASRYYEDALVRYEKGDMAGAIIQLKNALQIDRNQLAVQVLLGKALLAKGDVIAAEVAFNDALRLGVSRAEVVLPLAEALIEQGKQDLVLSDERFAVSGLPRPVQYRMLLLRAGAAGDMADLRTAMKSVEEARAIDATDPDSWTAEVPLRIRGRMLREAVAAADRAIAFAPQDAKAHFARGEALHSVPNLLAALSSYDKALDLDPRLASARVARAGIYIDLGRLDEARRDIEEALKLYAQDPRALYLKAVVADRQGRPAESKAALSEVTGLVDPIPPQFLRYRPQTQLLGGMAHYALGQREKARPYLESVLRAMPAHPVSKVLASIYLADRNVDSAIGLLTTYTRANPGDAQALILLASAHMSQGRYARATQIMQDALKAGDRSQLRTTLGLSLVGSARYGDAIREFEAAFARDPLQLPAGYALASLYVQAGRGKDALRVAEAVDKAHPRNPAVLVQLGSARKLTGDEKGARKAYETAIEADPGFVAAQVALARLDGESGAAQRARERLERTLLLDEKNQQTLMALAELAERSNQTAAAQRWLTKADDVSASNDAGPALALAELNLRNQQFEAAKDAARRAQSKDPDAVPTQLMLARVSLALGDAVAARGSLQRAATSAGFNPPLLVQIAALQLRAGAPQAAAHSLDKALSERADYLAALTMRAEVDIRLGELNAAEQRARQILAQFPRLSAGDTLLGDVAMARGQFDAALASYRRAHEIERSTASLMRLFAATARRDPAGATRLAEHWLQSHPKDALVWRALADTQLNRGQLAAARRSYESLLSVKPDDADAMNNLANVMLAQKDPAALRTAEQALALAPAAAHVIGTAGWAAFKAGQSERAIQMLRDARLRDPGNADTRYFLGAVLASLGRESEAREELGAAVRGGANPANKAEAERLLATLR